MFAARALATLAVLLALLAGMYFALATGTTETCLVSASGQTECRSVEGETLIEREGSAFVVVLVVPLLLALAVLLTLIVSPAWAIAPATILLLGNLLALASVGLFYLPATFCACLAALLVRRAANRAR